MGIKYIKEEFMLDEDSFFSDWHIPRGAQIWTITLYGKEELHNDDGPAIIQKTDETINEWHFIKGKLHKENGPAIIKKYYNGQLKSKTYAINGKLHNEYGPAFIAYRKDGSIKSERYYLEGALISINNKEKFKEKLDNWRIEQIWG